MLYIKEHRLKTYAIGVKAYAIGIAYSKTSLLLNSANPILRQLSLQTGHTAFIAKENNGKLIFTLKHEPTKRIIATPEIGDETYLHSTAIGKAILAFSPHHEELIRKLQLLPLTEHTITSKVALKVNFSKLKLKGMQFHAVNMRSIRWRLLHQSLIIMAWCHLQSESLACIKRVTMLNKMHNL